MVECTDTPENLVSLSLHHFIFVNFIFTVENLTMAGDGVEPFCMYQHAYWINQENFKGMCPKN